jgi:hypothetical protein
MTATDTVIMIIFILWAVAMITISVWPLEGWSRFWQGRKVWLLKRGCKSAFYAYCYGIGTKRLYQMWPIRGRIVKLFVGGTK